MAELDITLIVSMITGFTVILVGLYFIVIAPTNNFYKRCMSLEEDIKNKDDQDDQVQRLLKLNQHSLHKTTSDRVKQLALMIEVKYSIKLLNR